MYGNWNYDHKKGINSCEFLTMAQRVVKSNNLKCTNGNCVSAMCFDQRATNSYLSDVLTSHNVKTLFRKLAGKDNRIMIKEWMIFWKTSYSQSENVKNGKEHAWNKHIENYFGWLYNNFNKDHQKNGIS